MGLFNKFFNKKIKVKDDDMQLYFCVKHKRSGKKIHLNTELVVPEDAICVFCYKTKPCDVLKTGEYQLNGNSLPILYKKGNFNKPNKRNYIPDFFFANIWFVSTNNIWLDFDIERFLVKDKVYRKQRITLCFNINIKIADPVKFFKSLLYSCPRISKRRVVPEIIKWLKDDIRKYLKRQGYSITDYMYYTRGFNEELHSLLVDRFVAMGIEIIETNLEDVVMDNDLAREITDKRTFSNEMKESMGEDLGINNDGVKTTVEYERSSEQIEGSVASNYTRIQKDDEITIDDDSNFEPYNANSAMQNMSYNVAQAHFEQDVNDDYNNNKSASNFDTIANEQDDNFEQMYDMANEALGEENKNDVIQEDEYKVCPKCGLNVPMTESICPNCGCDDLKHKL